MATYTRNGTTINTDNNTFVSNLGTQQSYGNSAASYPTQYPMTPGGLYYLNNNADSYVNAMNQERAWVRDDLIRREGYEREDTAYQRLFADLKKAGINPVLALSSAESLTGSTGQSASSFKTSNYASNEKTDAANSARVVGAIIAALGMIIAAAL